jgi:restriction system protein
MAANKRGPKYGAVPKYYEFHWPVICALRETGGSASVAELYERVVSDMKLSEDVLAVAHGDGTTSEVEYRLAWARTYLKKVGAIDNSERGIWALTAKGRNFTEKDAADVVRQVRLGAQRTPSKGKKAASVPSEADVPHVEEGEPGWKEKLLGVLKTIPPDSFERLCQRVLRESGFTKVEVTGRSGDGGIDGAGVLRMNLISFHVLFQCKRWKDAVSAPVIRDFRRAMIGRADKGLVITTGRFTADAQREAVRDGAPAIDLVGGETLCDLLKGFRLGVEVRTMEVVEVQPDLLRSI